MRVAARKKREDGAKEEDQRSRKRLQRLQGQASDGNGGVEPGVMLTNQVCPFGEPSRASPPPRMDKRHLLATAGIAAVKWQKKEKKKIPAAASASRQEQIRTCARGEAELIWTPSAPVIALRLRVSWSGHQLLQPQVAIAFARLKTIASPRLGSLFCCEVE